MTRVVSSSRCKTTNAKANAKQFQSVVKEMIDIAKKHFGEMAYKLIPVSQMTVEVMLECDFRVHAEEGRTSGIHREL